MTAAELRTRLDELSWTQRHLAKMLGVTPRTVNRWTTGALKVPGYCAAYLAPPWKAATPVAPPASSHHS